MSYMSREEFLAQQAQRQTAQIAPVENRGPFVGFLKLADDGDEAIVRFAYSTEDEIYRDIITTHPGSAATKWKRINCINDPGNGVTNCPLCAAGQPLQQRLFIKLIEYVRNDDGSIVPYARIWDRPAMGTSSYVTILQNLFVEYGDISQCVFKIKRVGKKGDMKTTYNIMYPKQEIYNESLYPRDFSAYEGYELIGNFILNKSYQELATMAREISGFDQEVLNATTNNINSHVVDPYTSVTPQVLVSGTQTSETPTNSQYIATSFSQNTPPRKVVY